MRVLIDFLSWLQIGEPQLMEERKICSTSCAHTQQSRITQTLSQTFGCRRRRPRCYRRQAGARTGGALREIDRLIIAPTLGVDKFLNNSAPKANIFIIVGRSAGRSFAKRPTRANSGRCLPASGA